MEKQRFIYIHSVHTFCLDYLSIQIDVSPCQKWYWPIASDLACTHITGTFECSENVRKLRVFFFWFNVKSFFLDICDQRISFTLFLLYSWRAASYNFTNSSRLVLNSANNSSFLLPFNLLANSTFFS